MLTSVKYSCCVLRYYILSSIIVWLLLLLLVGGSLVRSHVVWAVLPLRWIIQCRSKWRWEDAMCGTVSFHNFKSRNFKLSVSNPKSKYVALLSVLSQISNCQSLGPKNKHNILKTDHTRRNYFILKSYKLSHRNYYRFLM